DASTCAKVWFSSITSTTCPEWGTVPPVGEGTGVGVGLGFEPGVGVGVCPGLAARLLLTPPQPATRNTAATTAVRMRALALAFDMKRLKPPSETGGYVRSYSAGIRRAPISSGKSRVTGWSY